MTALERQLTAALERLSAQYEMEQRRQSEQVEALRQRVERQTGENEALQRRIERLDGQVTRLAECYGTLAATLRGRVR
ncbi:MbeD/MobD family mobilization/exclusion protein [Candidatus Palauibacter sp.]|uniref:MbeD/MobD family mobilization/exclusion protein n=1 Tax=Candidatus Palauibacter sp. TaxID=3101350 RepID=UPI003C6FECCB